jgi:hypothetical protein
MRDRNDREKFLEILEDVPLVSVAARKAGIAKSTIYRWRRGSKSFASQMDAALKRGRETVNDLAESQLINLVRKGDFKSVKYWLDNNKKDYARPRPKSFWEDFFAKENPVTQIIIHAPRTREEIEKDKEKEREKTKKTKTIKFTVPDPPKDDKEEDYPDPSPAPSRPDND